MARAPRTAPLRPRPRPAEMTAATGLALIAAPCADRLCDAARPAAPGDAESVHQLRIRVRRLRAALSIFRDLIPRVERRRLRSALRWLLQVTGPLRDCDVMLDSRLRRAAESAGAAYAPALAASLAAAHARARRQASLALRGPRCARLLAGLQNFSAACRDSHRLQPEVAAAPLRTLADACLRRHHRKLRQRTRVITGLGARSLHRLRRHLRAQRDRTELLAGLYPRAAAQRYADGLQRLQHRLGAIHDLQVEQRLIAAVAAPSRDRPAQVRLERRCARQLDAQRTRLRDPRLDRGRLKPFWK